MIDRLLLWLMRPRVRRWRRWSFVATLPAALALAQVTGVRDAALLIALRVALWSAVALLAWRAGGERGAALRDLLMHPRARAFLRAELDVWLALPRVLLLRRDAAAPGARYDRRHHGVALAFAFTPMVVAEAVVVHLLIGGGPAGWILAAAHAYSLVWLWGFALGPRAYPHGLGGDAAVVLRAGAFYRVRVPRDSIASATVRAERVPSERGLVERDGAVLLPAAGRVDVWLELDEPVRVERPLAEPLAVRRLAIASDDPEALVRALLAPAGAAERPRRWSVLGAFEVAGVLRDATQPAA